ncbi:antitoxin [Streptomyces sp. SCSIO 75703]|uniref:antitoxin n=1 Tax=unclassified Streptomyces TaxID=2593676 RepID=UPI0004C2A473|nr:MULTISPECIES: antitoxin [unclassified Streptomyces]
MGIFDRFKSSQAAKDKAKQASDAVEKQVNKKTGGKYEDQVDTAQQKAEERFGMGRERGGEGSRDDR